MSSSIHQEFVRHAEDAFGSAVKDRLELVEKEGKDTLRLRLAIAALETRSVPETKPGDGQVVFETWQTRGKP